MVPNVNFLPARSIGYDANPMSTPSPALVNLARQLVAGERESVGSPHRDVDQAVRACERLRLPLTRLAGAAGFSSLLSRALALAKRQVPSLEGLRVEPDGSLAGFNETRQELPPAEGAPQGGVLLLAELLGLLVSLIGEPLTFSLVREAWPDRSLGSMTPSAEEKR